MTVSNQEGFKYVIQKQEQQKICFGSGCPRDIISKKYMNPFMRYYTLEDYPNIAPNSYNVLESFKAIKTKPCSHSISKKGYSGIARFSKKIMFKDSYPSPSHYDYVFPKLIHKSKYPFDSNSKRQTFFSNTMPGPGMYANMKKKVNMVQHSFGGKVKMKLGVELKCCNRNTDSCKICGKKPIGDYWHFKNEIFLCRSCMDKEYEKEIKFKRKELKKFHKIRDCSIMHQHETTTAKIWLIHPARAEQWIRKEAYLSIYFNE